MTNTSKASDFYLGPDGPIAKILSGYQTREEQITLARAIETTIQNQDILIAEAGTGTGKTFAYLLPALLANKKVIISTGTKNLQDQLFYRDIPLIRKAISCPKKIVLLKGRANYLCRERVLHGSGHRYFDSRKMISDLHYVQKNMEQTDFGDIAELNLLPEDAKIWPHVTSTKDNCLGQECGEYQSCYVVNARRKALKADIIIVNHHLFFADMLLRDEGLSEILPGADLVIFDEAHQIPEIASHFFGQRISSRQLLEIARDSEMEMLNSAPDMLEIRDESDALKKAVADMRIALPEGISKMAWHQLPAKKMAVAISDVINTLSALKKCLELAADRSTALKNCCLRAIELERNFKQLSSSQQSEDIHWLETFTKAFSIYLTPISIAKSFAPCLEKECGWVFTSATLTVNNDFKHFVEQLGLEKATTLQLESPFDFEQQALLYLPRDIPDPREKSYLPSVIDASLPVIESCEGGIFFLFTSHWALQFAENYLKERLDLPLFVQGSQPRAQLLEQFRECEKGVLLGTSSFWEGVDVRGKALSCVIIDKLPFAPPDDPILQARIQLLKDQGKNGFFEYQLPAAVISLKQGVGRLIRDEKDKGVLMIADPRLFTRSYGKIFMTSLPTMTITRSPEKVAAFYQECETA